ncbi:MAG: DUF1638 domain-containing protein [Deltaproteobacteria bacterium]|jgi:hypothetical protein|nr:DUF1638 domain-containing protein [Deltaproteobacteria bacterium]
MTKDVGILACDVIRNELLKVCEGKDFPITFLEYALHDKPKEMPKAITSGVEALMDGGAKKVLLGYGLCSNGTAGVSCKGGLVIPRCHDCISLLVGSPARYMKLFKELPGTYFLTDGWIRNEADPLTTLEVRYIPRLGEKRAWKGAKLELASYTKVCFINNGIGDVERLRKRSKENAKAFEMEYMEVEADLNYFERLIGGPYESSDFLVMGPDEPIDEFDFLESPEIAGVGGGR